MNVIKVYVETGKRRTLVSANDWPGWCRSGRDEKLALQALIEYGPRYAKVLYSTDIKFDASSDTAKYIVTERLEGNATTDFGAPAKMLETDNVPIDQKEYERFEKILQASWQAFDKALEQAKGKELRKGPRGGGRNIEKIMRHILEADQAYLRKLAWKHKKENGIALVEEINQTRQAILGALEVAINGKLPEKGPRGGVIWSPRYFVRRVAYHVVDHVWEIENRIE